MCTIQMVFLAQAYLNVKEFQSCMMSEGLLYQTATTKNSTAELYMAYST